jgi:hypothetical protein
MSELFLVYLKMLDYKAVVNCGSHRDCFLYKIDNVGLLVNTLKQGNVKKSRLYILGILCDKVCQ